VIEDIISVLKNPLKMYLSEANHEINLNIFTITNLEEKEKSEYLFWRCVNIYRQQEESKEKTKSVKSPGRISIK